MAGASRTVVKTRPPVLFPPHLHVERGHLVRCHVIAVFAGSFLVEPAPIEPIVPDAGGCVIIFGPADAKQGGREPGRTSKVASAFVELQASSGCRGVFNSS